MIIYAVAEIVTTYGHGESWDNCVISGKHPLFKTRAGAEEYQKIGHFYGKTVIVALELRD